jgi:ribonuclease Y
MNLAIIGVISLLVGIGAGYVIRKVQIAAKVNSVEAKVARALEEAKAKEREILLEAKAKAIEIMDAAKKSEQEFRTQIIKVEERLNRKESELDRKLGENERVKTDMAKKQGELQKLHDELKEVKQRQLEQLQKISGLSLEEAKKVLLDATEKNTKEELTLLVHKLVNQAHEDADRKAREIVALAVQRCASEVTSEQTTTTVTIPNEEMKGRII